MHTLLCQFATLGLKAFGEEIKETNVWQQIYLIRLFTGECYWTDHRTPQQSFSLSSLSLAWLVDILSLFARSLFTSRPPWLLFICTGSGSRFWWLHNLNVISGIHFAMLCMIANGHPKETYEAQHQRVHCNELLHSE